MKYFKLKNITKDLDKRDILFNKKIDVDIFKNHNRVLVPILPGETKYLVSEKLSVNMQKMREKKYLLVVEISKEEYEVEYNKQNINQTISKKVSTKKIETKSTTSKKEDESIKKEEKKK